MKNTFLYICYLSLLLLGSQYVLAQQPTNEKLPIDLPDGVTKPLRSYVDVNFEAALVKKMNTNLHWQKLIDQKQMSVGLVDLRDINNIKFARVNGNEMMYAASLPKIAVLLAMMDAFETGEIKETEEIKNDLNLMIGKSDNAATTRMIDLLGYEKIERVLTDPRYELYDEDYGGGLWVGKRYASTGERNPDPIKGISHAATASQVCRYYYLMAIGQLVTKERSAQMLEIMDDPKLHHKFVNSLDKLAPKARVFRKSGSWRTFHSDSVLVWGPKRRYILVALINDPDGENILRQLVVSVEDLMKF
ncbi:MAG: serine hydrolase [Cyclobacteriaceae bacterium]